MQAERMTVLARDPGCHGLLRPKSAWRVLRDADPAGAAGASHVFVLAVASELPQVAEFVRAANKRHHLRALLVHADVDPRWAVQMLDRANLRTLRNTLVHVGSDIPRRVLNAWRLGAQHDLIADVQVAGHTLMVQTCAMDRLEVPFRSLRALAAIPTPDRATVIVADDGSYLHWPAADIHLDLEVLRLAIDPDAQERAKLDRLRHDRRFGEAVAAVRQRHGLRQTDIAGVSARQVRRIEAGAFPRSATLAQLAAAHGLELEPYLSAVADALTDGGRAGR